MPRCYLSSCGVSSRQFENISQKVYCHLEIWGRVKLQVGNSKRFLKKFTNWSLGNSGTIQFFLVFVGGGGDKIENSLTYEHN